jgi:hypothetical protein
MWPKVGMNVVVNDNDGIDPTRRETRLELREGAMTRGKNGNRFAVFKCEPVADPLFSSAALFWQRRATPQGGFFQLKLATCGDAVGTARLTAVLNPVDGRGSKAAQKFLTIDLEPNPTERVLIVETDSPPGRYRLSVGLYGEELIAWDSLPVYVYPGD